MRKSKVTLETVRRLGLGLPAVEEGTAYGAFALKVGGKLMACVPTHRSAELGSLMVRGNSEDIKALLAEAPCLTTMRGTTRCWVRLSLVSADMMCDLLGMAHKFVTRKQAARPPVRDR